MTIDILGLGESLSEYKGKINVSIGVNDIYKHSPADYLVCVDPPKSFSKERLRTILNSQPKKFFTQLDCWQPLVRNMELIKFAHGNGRIVDLDTDRICYSNNSAYVACVLAYKMGAKVINLYGVDFNSHPNFKNESLEKTLNNYLSLYDNLLVRGVKMHCTKQSRLNEFIPEIK